MMNVLKNTIKGANALVLLLNGEQERFDYAFQQTIRYNSVILCCCSYSKGPNNHPGRLALPRFFFLQKTFIWPPRL